MTQTNSDSTDVQPSAFLTPEQHAALVAEILAKTLAPHIDITERTLLNRIDSVERKTGSQLNYVELRIQAQLKLVEQRIHDRLRILDSKTLDRWHIVDPIENRLFVILMTLVFIISCLLIK